MLKNLLIVLQLIFFSCNKYTFKIEQKSKGNTKIIEIFKNFEGNNENMQSLFDIMGISDCYKFFNYISLDRLYSDEGRSNLVTESFNLFKNFQCSEKINSLDEYGLNLFHYSILYSNSPTSIEMLIGLGADINLPTSEGKSALFLLLENKLSYPGFEKNLLKKYNYQLKSSKLQILLQFSNKIDFDFKYKGLSFQNYIKKLIFISNKLRNLSEDAKIDFEFYSSLDFNLEIVKKNKNICQNDKNINLNQNDKEEVVIALSSHNLNRLKDLLKNFKNEEISKICISGKDLLISSIYLNFLNGTKFLIPYFNINNSIYLKYALFGLNRNVVLELLPKIFNINFYDKEGFTPLMLLTRLNIFQEDISIWKELATLLIQSGADINMPCLNDDYLNFTALHFSVFSYREIAEFLIDMGANINVRKQNLKVKKLNGQYKLVSSPLEYAIFNQKYDMAKFLIEKGASTFSLNCSLTLYDINLNKEMCELLFPYIKGKLNFSQKVLNERGTLLCNTLTRLKNLPIVAKELLPILEKMIKDLKEDVNYEHENFPGENCLFIAIHTRCPELVELLLKNGAKASKKKNLTTLYNEAILCKNLEILRLLLEYKIKIDLRRDSPFIPLPLNLAVILGDREISKALLEDKRLAYDKLKLISDVTLGSEALELSEIYDKDIINKYPNEHLIHITALVGSHRNLRFLINEGYSPFLKINKELKFENINYNFFKEMDQKPKTNFLNFYHIKKGQNALDISMERQDLKAFSIIMEFYQEKELEKNIKEFIENNYMFGNKTLLVNIEKGYYGIVKILLNYKEFSSTLLDINYIDEDGNTLLDYLLEDNSDENLITLLKEKRALRAKEIEERIRVEQEENSLINNVIIGNEGKVLKIIENDKLEVIKADHNNITPLTACVVHKRLNILKIIIKTLKEINKLNTNIDRVDIENKTALSYAIDSKNYEIIKILLENGANVNFKYCRKYSYITELAFDNSNGAKEIIKMLYDKNCLLSNNDIKFLFKNKNLVNPYVLKLFESSIKKYENLYSFKIQENKKVSKIEKILIDKEALKYLENISKENLDKLNNELKNCLKGQNFSDSRDLSTYKPKFGEIRLISNISSDRIFYIKKGSYLVILDIYLNKRKRLLPNYIYDKAFEKCKLYKGLINKNSIEALASYSEPMDI